MGNINAVVEQCPFCGDDKELVVMSVDDAHFMFCQECGAQGPQTTTHEEAVKLWDSRVKIRERH